MNVNVKESKKAVVNNEVVNEITTAILTPKLDLLKISSKNTKDKKAVTLAERIEKLIPIFEVQRLRKLRKFIRMSDNLTPKIKKELDAKILVLINQFNKDKAVKRHALYTAKVRTEKFTRINQNKVEFQTITNIIKSIKDADKKRNTPYYGVLKSKSFKLTALNLFLSSNQFADVLTKGGLYNYESINNAVEKLQGIKDVNKVNLIYAHAEDVITLINSGIPFIDKLTQFELLKEKVQL